MPQGRLGLSDAEFWTDPKRTEDEVGDALRDEDFRGLLLDAPRRVPTDTRETLPARVVRRDTLKKTQTVAFKTRGFVVAVEQETGRSFVAMAIEQKFKRGKPDADAGEPPPGTMIERFALDLRKRLDLPWKPGRYRAAVILMDQITNPVELELGPAKPSYEDEEVKKFLEAQRKQSSPRRLEPMPGDDPLPSYERDEETPEVPAEPGVTLKVARVQYLEPDLPVVLRGSFRLPVHPQQVVKPREEDDATDVLPEPRPTAVVPITLVLTGSETPRPDVWNLEVPTYDPIDPDAESPVVTGCFTVDVGGLGNVRLQSQTFFVYAFAGETVTGPVPMALLTPDMKPR